MLSFSLTALAAFVLLWLYVAAVTRDREPDQERWRP